MAKRAAYMSLMVAIAFVISACGKPSDSGAAPTPSSTPTTMLSPSPSPSPSPSAPPPVDPAALAARIKRAVVTTEGLRSLGAGVPREDGAGKWAVTTQCNRALSSDPQLRGSYRRTWETNHGILQSFVHGYSSTTGAQVVDEVRTFDGVCKSYRLSGENADRRVLGRYTTQAPAGITDYYAYCEQAAKAFLCFGFLAYDNLVAVVVSVSYSLTNAKSELDQVLKIAAKGLTRA